MREPLLTIDPEIMGGTPVFAGTRVPLKTLIDYLETGESLDEFLDDFPTVSREQVTRYLHVAQKLLVAAADAHLVG